MKIKTEIQAVIWKINIEIGQKYYDPDITPLLKNAFAILGLDFILTAFMFNN